MFLRGDSELTPIVYDLYCGLGGWTEGFLSEGYRCIGFDIEAHDYGTGGYPGELRIRDIRSIHGSELKDATCIVGSSPCQEFSYRAMPWKRAKALPPPYLGIELFNAQFRIQREAIEVAGHYIPMVVENVRGAQKWVGRAKANYGSFYLWGDVGMVGRRVVAIREGKLIGAGIAPTRTRKFNPDGTAHGTRSWFAIADSKNRGVNSAKVPGFRFDGSGGSFQTAAVKTTGHINIRDGFSHTRHLTNQKESDAVREGCKGAGAEWFDQNLYSLSSKSISRKQASALIAKIPFALSSHIARCLKPIDTSADEKVS
jgi:hypothetical protein